MEIYWVRPSHHYYSSQAMEVSPVIIKGLLQLSLLLVHVAKVGVGLCQQGVLLDGQGAEVRRLVVLPALEMDRAEQQENPSVRWILNNYSVMFVICWVCASDKQIR